MTLGQSMKESDMAAAVVSLAYSSYQAQRKLYGMSKEMAFRLFAPEYGEDTVNAWEVMYGS